MSRMGISNSMNKGRVLFVSLSLIFIFLVFPITASAVIGDCVLCHDLSNATTNSTVNVSAMNQSWSNHYSLNSGAITSLNPDNERCWACHAMSIEPTSDNHTNWNNSAYIYDCLDCHNRTKNLSHTNATRILNLSASDLYEHIPTGDTIGTYSIQNCTDCHTNSLNYSSQNESVRGNVSHYGTTSQLLSSTTDCRLCHANSTNAINYNVTSSNLRHPAQSSDPTFCANCHGNTSTNLHDSNLSYGRGDIHMSFDWEDDGVEDTDGMQQAIEGCFVCHNQNVINLMGSTTDSNTRICEECHVNTSFTGPFNNSKLNITTSAINDSMPRVLMHTNLSSVITVANQSLVPGSDSNLSTPSSCYSYNTGTGNGSCHAIGSDKIVAAGGYFAFYNNTTADRMDAYRFTGIIDRLPNTSDCRLCHLGVSPNGTLVNSSWWAYPVNVSSSRPTAATAHTNASAVASDCWVCHAVSANKPKDFHSQNVSRGGGPDCISCHGISGTALHLINETAMNSSGAVHANLNSNATNSTGVSVENKKCWGCHQSGGTEPVGMGDRYLTPYECYDCHNSTKAYMNVSSAPIVSEHFTSGDNITAGYAANDTYSCLSCHNKSELQVDAIEPDIYNSTISKASHYATNMFFLRINGSIFCEFCHNIPNNAFVSAMNDTSNEKVLNHTDAATNPSCIDSTCHGEGWLHNSSLKKPTNLDYTLCTQCHTTKANHSGKLDCTACHTNSTEKIHPIQYLTTTNTTVAYDSSSAANCTTCHQQSSVDGSMPTAPPKIPVILNHSEDPYAGGKWNVSGQSFWSNTSAVTSCDFCHTNDIHSASPLGNISTIVYGEVRNGSIGAGTNSTWCGGCHYDGDSDYANMSAAFGTNRPPSITNASHPDANDGTAYYNHSLLNYSDYWCSQCHNLFSATTTVQFVHNLSIGVSGGRDCVGCHDIAGLSPKIDVSAANNSTAIHKDLNNNSTGLTLNANNQRCWACHGDGNGSEASQPASGHPVNYTSPKVCEDCHTPTIQFAAPQVFEHFASGNELQVSTACSTCHNENEMKLANNDPNPLSSTANSSASHYGKTRSDIVSGGVVDCDYCHQNTSSVFPLIGNHSNIGKHNTPNPVGCANSTCHDSGRMHDQNLTKPSLTLPNSTYCQTCHSTKSQHNSTVNCSSCHINSTFDIHTINFIQDGGGFATTNASAVTCTSCHQSTITGFAAPNAGTLNHSSDPDSGSKWNATGYWSNQSTSCIFCHNNTLHTADALGNLAPLRGVATNFSGSVCGSCHRSNNTYYANVTSNLTILPPEILTNITSTDGTVFINHTGLANYTDASCKLCHENTSSVPANVTEMAHDTAAGNFSNCISCHASGFLGAPVVNTTSLNNSIHGNLNNANTSLNYACWACHYDGTAPSIHPTNLSDVKACEDCHTKSSPLFSAPVVVEHRPAADDILTNTTEGCLFCHNNSVDPFVVYSNNASRISHSGTTTYLMTPSNNSTQCMWCHFDNPTNGSWGTPVDPQVTVPSLNHSQFTNSTECYTCHVAGGGTPPHFHDASLSPGAGKDCVSCHDIGGAAPSIRQLDVSSTNRTSGIHYGLNSNSNGLTLNPANQRCWACHGDGDGSEAAQPVGHPVNYKTPKDCSQSECHSINQSIFYEPMIYSHFNDSDLVDNSGDHVTENVSTNSRCQYCHDEALEHYNENAESPLLAVVSHYGSTSGLVDLTDESCTYCHRDDDIDDREYAEDWGNATDPMDNVSALTDIRKMEKVTIEQGDSYNLGNGYYFTVGEIDLKGRQALFTLKRHDDTLARPVTDADDQYLYYEWWVDDGDEFNQTLVSIDTLDVFRGDDRDKENETRVLAQFEARGIKRLHNNQDVGVCWVCHTKNPTVKQDEYVVLEKENDRTYYAPIYADFNDEDSPITSLFIEEGSGWEAGDYMFMVDELDIKGQKARISLYYKDNLVKDDVVDTGDIFEYYRDDIVYENYDFDNTTFFTVTVTDIFRSEERILATFDNIKAISLDIVGISEDNDNGSGNDYEKGYAHEWFGGYNISWLRINDTFKVGGRPDTVHSPMFIDGADGGADCVMCHDATMNFEIENLVSVNAIRTQLGAHAGMNFAAENDTVLTDEVDKSCWACHGGGGEPTRHPINYKSPRPCQSCHTWREEPTYGAVDLSDVDHGKQEHCTICHAASGDIHVIFPRRIFADIEGLTLTPSSLFERRDVQVNATAVSGWGMKVEQVEYFLDTVTEDGTGIPMIPVDGAFDSGQEDVTAYINTSGLDFGIHTVHVHTSERGGRWGYMRNETFIILTPEIIKPIVWPYVLAAFLLAIILWSTRFRVRVVRISNRTPVIGESIKIKASAYVGLNRKKSIESIMYRLDSSDAVGIEMDIADVSGRRSVKASTVLDTSGLRPGHHVVFVNAKRSDGKWCSLKPTRFDLLRSNDE